MYTPAAFREDRREVLNDLIASHPLGLLVTSGSGGLIANLLPFSLVATPTGDVLRAHLAKANDQLPSLREGVEALVIFQGPAAYITPSWYATKREHQKVVPTWNFVIVQAWGVPTVIDDVNWLRAQIDQLTDARERDGADPWSVSDAPPNYIGAQLKGIVGLEIPIRKIEGKWKVSQNQPEANRRGVTAGLRDADQPEMAALVERGVSGS